MHFLNIINELSKNKKILMFVDMDGVIASYDVGKPLDFVNKRPLYNNINIFRELSNNKNVELHILSICKIDDQIKEKNDWLDKYASFFNKENRHIISRESNDNKLSKILKKEFLINIDDDKDIILIDDDNEVLYEIKNSLKDIILFQDSELVD